MIGRLARRVRALRAIAQVVDTGTDWAPRNGQTLMERLGALWRGAPVRLKAPVPSVNS